MIDQRKLPGEEVYVRCKTAKAVAKAITTMVIRGAPAIGVAAAMGLALGVRISKATGTKDLAIDFYKLCELLGGTRPTAVNLFWSIERMKRCFADAARAGQSPDEIRETLVTEARSIESEDIESCRALGAFGAAVVPDDGHVLTHCNAGALATSGYGTALGVIRAAVAEGKRVGVYADETRPFLQGARLTAWELVRDGIDTTVITDSMAGPLMRGGKGRCRCGWRRQNRRQRRCRQQDRDIHCGGNGEDARCALLCGSTVVDSRLDNHRRVGHPNRRAHRTRSHPCGLEADGTRRRPGLEIRRLT